MLKRINYIIGNSSKFFGAMNKEQRKLFYQMADNINIDFIVWSIKAILNWIRKQLQKRSFTYTAPKILCCHL
jgi:hypothetical protein